MTTTHPLGFRMVGGVTAARRTVDWAEAFNAYAAAEARLNLATEAYLSAFTYGEDFREHLNRVGSVRGFVGSVAAPWVWFDIDRDATQGGIEAALADARRLATALVADFALSEDALLLFYSGSKGFHVGLPTAGFMPAGGADVAQVAGYFADVVATRHAITIDASVYDRVRAFRAPNSRHAKSGLYKLHLTYGELLHLRPDAIRERAASPAAFEVPDASSPILTTCGFELPAAWNEARTELAKRSESHAEADRRERDRLNRSTLDLIRGEPPPERGRHKALFMAAANLGEFGCTPALARALLLDVGMDFGLAQADVARQVECGLAHTRQRVEAPRAAVPEWTPDVLAVEQRPPGAAA